MDYSSDMEYNNHLNVLIVEDELHNSRMLCDMVNKLRPSWEVIDIVESVEDTVEWLKENSHPDLMLLDIQLADGISFSIFEQVAISLSTKIIFITAYDEYAIQAFKVNSVDYLLKPVKESMLEYAFQKLELFEKQNVQSENELYANPAQYKQFISSIVEGRKEYRKRFLISGVKSSYSIEVKEVAYIQSINKITMLMCHDGKEHVLNYTLEQLETELDSSSFFRANRQVIVHINSVDYLQNIGGGKLSLELKPKTTNEIIVSRLKAAEFKNWLGK